METAIEILVLVMGNISMSAGGEHIKEEQKQQSANTEGSAIIGVVAYDSDSDSKEPYLK